MCDMNYHLVWLFLLLGITGLKAQSDTLGPMPPTTDIGDLLPPLSLLIDSALANAPEMRMADASVANSEYSVQHSREDWTELVYLNGRYTYGQFIGNDAFGLGFAGGPRGGYQVFAGVRVPLSYFVSRSERLGMMESELALQRQSRRQTERMVREKVIETYNELLLLQKLINITGEARESAELQYQIAEDSFREGQISLEELGRSTDMRAKFASEYEKLRSQFSATYTRLERLVGTPFSNFPR